MANNDIHYIRKELDHLQTRMQNMDIRTEYALSNSDTTPPTTGWSTVRPVAEEGEFIWARNIINMGYGDITTEPYLVGDGTEHILSLDVEYISWGNAFSPPPQDSPYWQTTAPPIQEGQYIWSRDVIVTTNGTKYTSPVRITGVEGADGSDGKDGKDGKDGIDGKAGKDGKGLEFIFKRLATKVDNWNSPPSGVVNPATLPAQETTDDYVPTGWTDDQEEVTESLPYQYVSVRTKTVSTGQTDGKWGTFNTPKLWSTYGEKPFCHIRYADLNPPLQWSQTYPNPQTSGQGGITYHKYEGYLWNADETLKDADKDPSKFSWRIYRPTIGIAGEEGSYLHIAYADDDQGTGFNQYSGAYMGTCVTWEEEDPDDPTLYNWVKIEGRSILAIVEEYGMSNSSSTPPSTWYTDVNQILVGGKFVKGTWYWTRSHIYYSDEDEQGHDDEVVGTRIINMVDSDTEHYIFFRTATNNVPTTPTSSTPIIDNKNQEGKDIASNSWFEEVISPTAELPYLWCSMQEYNGLSKGWGAYCTPYLVDTYSFDGTVGEQGDTGGRGADGTQLTGGDIVDKTTDISSSTMENCVPSDFVPSQYYSAEIPLGEYSTMVHRQGNIVIINFRATFVSSASQQGEYIPVIELPSWATPLSDTFFSDAVHGNPYRVRVNEDSNTPFIWHRNDSPSTSVYATGTVMYFASESIHESPQFELISPTNMKLYTPMIVRLSNSQGEYLSNTVVYFKIQKANEDGVIYRKVTGNDGIAELNINTPLDGENDVVAVWYDGYNYEGTEITTPSEKYCAVQKIYNITTNPPSVTHIDWGESNKGYYFEVTTGSGNPLRYAEVDINIMKEGFWTAYTNGEGRVYFDLMGYDATHGVEVFVRLNKSNKVFDTVYDTHVFKLSTPNQTVSRFPVAIAGNNWEGLDKSNLASPRDDKFVKSTVVAYNSNCPVLRVDFGDLKLPSNATVTKLKVTGVFASLEGTKQISRPKLGTPVLTGGDSTASDNTYSFINQNTVSWDYTNCGKWQSVNYTCNISSSDTNNWEDFSVYIDGGLNSGDINHRDDGRFAVDYMKLEVEYTVDNTSLIPSTPPLDIQVYDLVKYYRSTDQFKVKVLENGSPVQGKSVTTIINTVRYRRTTGSDGIAKLNVNLNVGEYPIAVEVDEYILYAKITVLPTIWFDKNEYNILENSNSSVSVNCRLNNGDRYNGTIQTNLNGEMDTVNVVNGIAEVPIPNDLAEGDYILTVTNNDTGDTDSVPIHIVPRINIQGFTKYFHCDKQLEGYILDANGNPAKGEKVQFYINGVYYERTTDLNGYIKLNINLAPDIYTTDIIYDGITKTVTFEVLPRVITADMTKRYGTDTQFVAKILDCNGANIKTEVDVYFNINGVLYTRQTDENGDAKLNINLMAGTYVITTAYDGEVHGNTITITN